MDIDLKRLLVPSLSQALGCIGLSLAGFIALYRQEIGNRFGTQRISGVLSGTNYRQALANVTNNGLSHTVVIIFFWSLIGLLAYTVVWSLINVTIEARNEVVLQTEYVNRSGIAGRLKAPLLQITLAVILVVLLIVSAKLIFPFWLDLFYSALTLPGWGSLVIDLVAALVGSAANLYFLFVLGQLVFLVD